MNDLKNKYIVGIGCQKSGTTLLYDLLHEHVQIDISQTKELHYFDRSKLYPSSNALSEEFLIERLRNTDWVLHALKAIS